MQTRSSRLVVGIDQYQDGAASLRSASLNMFGNGVINAGYGVKSARLDRPLECLFEESFQWVSLFDSQPLTWRLRYPLTLTTGPGFLNRLLQ